MNRAPLAHVEVDRQGWGVVDPRAAVPAAVGETVTSGESPAPGKGKVTPKTRGCLGTLTTVWMGFPLLGRQEFWRDWLWLA